MFVAVQSTTESDTFVPRLVMAGDGSTAETPEEKLRRLEGDLNLQRARKHVLGQSLKDINAYWKNADAYIRSVWRARQKRRARRNQTGVSELRVVLLEGWATCTHFARKRATPRTCRSCRGQDVRRPRELSRSTAKK